MQPFRLFAVVVGTGLTFSALLARANDTPAQAAARAALQQQMNQMDNGQPPTNSEVAPTNSAPTPTEPSAPPAEPSAPPVEPSTPPAEQSTPPTAPSAPPVAAQPPPVAVQPPPVATPTPQFSTNIPVTPEEESQMAPAKMSQTNESATAEMNNQTNLPAITAPPPAALTNETTQYPVNPPMAPLPPAQGESSMQPPTAPLDAQPMPVSTGAQSIPPAQQAPPVANGNGPNIQNEPHSTTNAIPNLDSSIKAPPLPISQEQQAELQGLLQQYMANQITPAQYQERRAQIIGQQ